MKAVGVKELKARLSEYLRAVKAGETLLVTDRDDVVAEIRPVSGRLPPKESVEALLDSLADTGELTRSRMSEKPRGWKSKGIGLTEQCVTEVLDDLRSDRTKG